MAFPTQQLVKPCLALATSLLLNSAIAETPTYIADGIYPGMPATQAKAAGYSRCSNNGYGDMSCQNEKAAKEVFGVPVKSVIAEFESPYTVISKITIKFDTVKKSPNCGKKKGPWGDVIGPECVYDLSDEISKIYGKPISSRFFTTWHKCGRYQMMLENHVSTLTITDNPEDIDSRKYACEQAQKELREKSQKEKEAADFMKRMK